MTGLKSGPTVDSADESRLGRERGTSGSRLHHIDGMRALAILFMVWVHIAAAFRPVTTAPLVALAVSSAFGGLAAPLFVTISGWGLHRSASRRIATAASPFADVGRWLAPRIALLVVCQLIINLLMSHVFHWSTPGVLTLLALAAVLAPCTAGLATRTRAALAMAFALSPLLLGDLTGLGWTWDQRMGGADLVGTFERLFWNGAYPALPWLAFSLLGSLIADMPRPRRLTAATAMIPIALAATFLLRPEGGELVATIGLASLTFFPASTPFVLVAATTVLWIHLGLESTEESAFWKHRSGRDVMALGNLSLTVYVLHFMPLAMLWHTLGAPRADLLTMSLMVITYTVLWIPLAGLHTRFLPRLSLERLLERMTSQ